MSNPAPPRGLGAAGWFAIAVMLAFLLAAIAYSIYGWNRLPSVGIPWIGWLLLIGGIAAAAAVGIGLMSLVFWSSRRGRDF